jgi:anion-transporting  ArsA/GET3 family ATPase
VVQVAVAVAVDPAMSIHHLQRMELSIQPLEVHQVIIAMPHAAQQAIQELLERFTYLYKIFKEITHANHIRCNN